MKILFVVDSFSGGAGNVIQILASEFAKKNYKVEILLLNGKRINEKYDMTNVIVHDCALSKFASGSNPISRIVKGVKLVRNKFNDINPDVIVSFLTENNVLCSMANYLNKPIIVSERNDPFKEFPKIHWRILRSIEYKKVNKVVVQCGCFKDYFKGKIKNKAVVIPNPILKPKKEHSAIEKQNIKLVTLGRLAPQKNFSWLIDAMVNINKKNPYIYLEIYGEGPMEVNLQNKIKENNLENCIKLMGQTSTPHEVLAQSDIYVMTSDYEGFPNALSEAMAVGLPSISRLCHSGIMDLVEDKVNGFLVESDNMQKFEELVIKLAEDTKLRKSISEKAKQVSNKFSVENILDAWEHEIVNESH